MKKLLSLALICFITSPVFAGKNVTIRDGQTSGYEADVFKIGSQYGLGVDTVPASTIVNGQKTVTTAGTAETLASSTSVRSVCIKALHGNTNNVYVGDSSVDSSNGYVLDSGETLCIDIQNLATIYIDTDTNGEGVSYVGIN